MASETAAGSSTSAPFCRVKCRATARRASADGGAPQSPPGAPTALALMKEAPDFEHLEVETDGVKHRWELTWWHPTDDGGDEPSKAEGGDDDMSRARGS